MALALPVEAWGRGVPTVFLHGFTGSRTSWRGLEAHLGDVLEARCLSLPGHDGVPVPAHFDQVVEAIAAAIERPSVLVGYSQGARLALAVAARFPERISRLVLESGSPGLRRSQERTARRAADARWIALLEEHGVEAFADQWEAQPLFASLESLPAAQRAELRARRTAHTAEGLAGALRVYGTGAQPAFWAALPGLRIPTLLLTGSRDLKFTHLARRMAAELPMAWRRTFRGVGHAPHLECPELWAREVRSFLAARHTDTLPKEKAA